MAQDTVTLAGSERLSPPGAELIGKPDPSRPAELTIVVRRRAPVPMDHVASGAQFTRAQFAEQFGADPADLKAVERYAVSEGLSVESTDPARRVVVVAGTFEQIRKAFDADVSVYRQGGQTFNARSGVLCVPAKLAGVIEGIFGYDERPQAHSRLRHRSPAKGGHISAHQAGTSFSPVEIAALYQFPKATGAGQTIAIIELGGGYATADLKKYFSGLKISPEPKVTAVKVDGGKNALSGDPNSADGEVELDIEVAGSIAPGAKLVVYFAPNTTRGFLDAITTAVHDSKHDPSVISISWGGPEDTYTGQSLTSYDQAFQDAAALGVTVCIASGDSGSTDGETDGNQHVDFPASSPHALACGGTSLKAAGGAIESETVWNDGSQGGATGGGVSETFPVPTFQSGAHVPVSANSSKFAGRGVPDVAGNADPATGYNVLVDGSSIVVGGTSAVAPLWAALIALVNEQTGKRAGFVNPTLYQNATAFHDITEGANGAYKAAAGWDPCTGLGSPIGTAVLQALEPASPDRLKRPPAPLSPSGPVTSLS